MVQQKKITIEPCTAQVAFPHLELLFNNKKTDTTGGTLSAGALLSCCVFFVVKVDGLPSGYYALQQVGAELVVVAASGGAEGVDLVASVMPAVIRQAEGLHAVTVHTKRRGLIAKLAAQGFKIEGFILRKALK